MDSAESAASTLSRKGSLAPNLATHAAPSSSCGSAAITLSSVVDWASRSRPEGAEGWAPIHSSASGPGAGAGRPWSSAIACRDPQA
jgi:hypothetical protein